MNKIFENSWEKEDLAIFGFILNWFKDIEYQIDEVIAFFLSRHEQRDLFMEIVTSELNFGSKIRIFRRILENEKIKEISKLTKEDFNFIKKYQEVRNHFAHGDYVPQDGDFPASIVGSKAKSFKLPNREKLLKLKQKALSVGKKILDIQRHWWDNKDNIPVIRHSTEDKWINFDF